MANTSLTGAGKPHNIICSQCLKPANLIWCSTCCRSYHAACLALPPSVESIASWSCPSCQERREAVDLRLDQLPAPQISSLASDTAGGSIAPILPALPHNSYGEARKFLADHGFPNNQEITSEFVRDLQDLITKAELASQNEQELMRLRGENSQLIDEIRKLRAGSESQLSPSSSAYSSQQGPAASAAPSFTPGRSEIPRLDVTEKSWDRIISEGF